MNAVVDLHLLCRPAATSAEDAFDLYIENLSRLLYLSKKPAFKLAVPEQALQILGAADAIPPLQPGEMRHLHASDVARVFFGLLDRAVILEIATGVNEVLYTSVQLKPDHCPAEVPGALRDNFERCLTIIGTADKLGLPFGDAFTITGFGPAVWTTSISTTLEEIDTSVNQATITTPFALLQEVECVAAPQYCCMAVGAAGLLKQGRLRDAIDLTIARERVQSGEVHQGVWPFVEEKYDFHPRFADRAMQVLNEADASWPDRFLRACSETVLSRSMRSVHKLRVSAGGGSPQRERAGDSATAWRRDIDYEYHLHYWQAGQRVQFAWVGPHNDFSIPD